MLKNLNEIDVGEDLDIGLNIVSYPVTDAFIPEWKAIKKIIQNNSVSLNHKH